MAVGTTDSKAHIDVMWRQQTKARRAAAWPAHTHGLKAIVLSALMLLTGSTFALAQTGISHRCEALAGQARGLCTAAVLEDCFAYGDVPDQCDNLTAAWHNQCPTCEGEAPWSVACPCGDAVAVAETFEAYNGDRPITISDLQDARDITVYEVTVDFTEAAVLSLWVQDRRHDECFYLWTDDSGMPQYGEIWRDLTTSEQDRCRGDVRDVVHRAAFNAPPRDHCYTTSRSLSAACEFIDF